MNGEVIDRIKEYQQVSEADFENMVCDAWTGTAENWLHDYQKAHGDEPSRFKTFAWGMRLAFKLLGVEIKR